jgi:hypothetical protein
MVNSTNTVVGVDGSDESGDAIALAVTLAEPLAGPAPVSVHPSASRRDGASPPVRSLPARVLQRK